MKEKLKNKFEVTKTREDTKLRVRPRIEDY